MQGWLIKILKIIIAVLVLTTGVAIFWQEIAMPWLGIKKSIGQHLFEQEIQQETNNKNGQLSTLAAVGHGMQYDYKRFIKLIKKARNIKEAYTAQFIEDMPRKKRKQLDLREIKGLLTDLYRERVRLERYIKELRVLRKGQLPIKQSRALSYYDKVLEKDIKDLEFIVQQL